MTSINLKPGINNVFISIGHETNNELMLVQDTNNDIYLNFTLTGTSKLRDTIHSLPQTFHLYIFLTYQHGGRETEVISSSQIYCDKLILSQDNTNFKTVLTIPSDKLYLSNDFILNYYALNIAFFEREAEDGADLNRLIYGIENSIFNTKLNLSFQEGEFDE